MEGGFRASAAIVIPAVLSAPIVPSAFIHIGFENKFTHLSSP
jgi:hypothetical protein